MKIKFFLENNLIGDPKFIPVFKYLFDFAIVIWKWVKPEPLKERFQKLILAVLSISNPLKSEIKNNNKIWPIFLNR